MLFLFLLLSIFLWKFLYSNLPSNFVINTLIISIFTRKKRKIKVYKYFGILSGTKERRTVLRQSKLFECDCCRCSDPTEYSTYLSALCCPKCTTGFVLPVHPLDEKETDWQCSQCPYILTASIVNRVIDNLKKEFEFIGPNDVEKYFCFFRFNDNFLWLFKMKLDTKDS